MIERFLSASGIIFDCDGCLLDSMRAWREVEFSLIDMTGVPWPQGRLEEMRAAPMHEACRMFHEDYGVMESTDAVMEYMQSRMLDYYENRAEMRPGAREFLSRVRTASVPCCVVSSTPARYLEPALRLVGIRDELADVLSTEETGLSKQDPAIYERALSEMGAQAESAWGFDDSLYAIRVMKGMGLSCVGTYEEDHAGTYQQLSECADIAVHSFEELLA